MNLTHLALNWTEQGLVPDAAIRAGIRRLLRRRKDEIGADDAETGSLAAEAFIASMDRSPVALLPEKANEQHYEVPADFYAIALGRHRKYSACHWSDDTHGLDIAEARALSMTCRNAQLDNGQEILELGCGWGSLTLWMAVSYPGSTITAVSNSASQRDYILGESARLGLDNVNVITADMNSFDTPLRFDRVVSVEMFEHMRNWPVLFRRVHDWMKVDGLFFMHVFVHRLTPYAFVERGEDDWMSRYFFSGGMMPSDDLALRCQDDLRVARVWRWNGTHYERTANAWLANMDAKRAAVLPVLEQTYGHEQVNLWWQRWRIFFMSCAELFGYDSGQEWWVSHYLFERRA